jgi:Flp pilus assembly pilin Flp
MVRRHGARAETHRDGSDSGATAVEYALFAALIAVVVAGVVLSVGLKTNGAFANLLAQWP